MFKLYKVKWGLFLSFLISIIGFLPGLGHLDLNQFDLVEQYFLFSFVNVFACWFIHHYFILHQFRKINHAAKAAISNISGVTAIMCIDLAYSLLHPKSSLLDVPSFDSLNNFLINLSRASFVCVFCYIIVYNIQMNITLQKSKLENEILKQAQLQAQLLSLQQQISPHFLFNSLSTLKTIAPDRETKNYVVELAHVYRYLLNFNEANLASVKDELAFMKSYLYILQERFEAALDISIRVPSEYLLYCIPPLSLQLLIENAIKHNIISPEKPLHIFIYTGLNQNLVIENTYQPKLSVEESTGKGLQNIKDRYELLSGKQITVNTTHELFTVSLPLLLS